jgi:peptidoglycan hydrolase-like protein with peptidoglycan-binding domain
MNMKRVLLVTAACLSLSVPAMAQNTGGESNQPRQMQNQTQSQPENANAQAGNQQQMIEPSQLNRQEVSEIQTNLDKAGFNVKKVDGKWGPETEQALKQFQQSKQLPGNGELNQQTLAALNVNINNESQTTGSSRKPANAQPQEQNQNTSGGSQGSGSSSGNHENSK